MSKYMIVLLLSFCVPFMCSFWPPLKFYSRSKEPFYSIGWVLLIYGAWDVFAVWRHHWSFDTGGVWPLRIINLPVEEVLFFIVIPFCCIFTWEALLFILKKNILKNRVAANRS